MIRRHIKIIFLCWLPTDIHDSIGGMCKFYDLADGWKILSIDLPVLTAHQFLAFMHIYWHVAIIILLLHL